MPGGGGKETRRFRTPKGIQDRKNTYNFPRVIKKHLPVRSNCARYERISRAFLQDRREKPFSAAAVTEKGGKSEKRNGLGWVGRGRSPPPARRQLNKINGCGGGGEYWKGSLFPTLEKGGGGRGLRREERERRRNFKSLLRKTPKPPSSPLFPLIPGWNDSADPSMGTAAK